MKPAAKGVHHVHRLGKRWQSFDVVSLKKRTEIYKYKFVDRLAER